MTGGGTGAGAPALARVLAAGALAALCVVAAGAIGTAAPVSVGFDAAVWRKAFARPDTVPVPAGNPQTPARIALGRQLFEDPRLSGDGRVACADCHQPVLSFTDGVPLHGGLDGKPLTRRSPSLWNVAFGSTFFWDGRARTLEDQAAGPIENPREMGARLDTVVARLAADPATAARFAEAFPDDPRVSERTLAAALAAFERTLVSPETRFDQWVKGDDAALAPSELRGLKLFVGKAGCVACHTGWRFTDEAFHDIGLPSDDLGRGGFLKLPAAGHAFKTPSLRERVWTAPYMHDGSLPSFEAVIDHYADHVTGRPTLSSDLRRHLDLDEGERADLVAFLQTLSSDDPPRPVSMPAHVQTFGLPDGMVPVATLRVSQRDRQFAPRAVVLSKGEGLTIVNDDTRTHNVRVDDPRMPAVSEAQEPGDAVALSFPAAGHYRVTCGIHPDMTLDVDVREH